MNILLCCVAITAMLMYILRNIPLASMTLAVVIAICAGYHLYDRYVKIPSRSLSAHRYTSERYRDDYI